MICVWYARLCAFVVAVVRLMYFIERVTLTYISNAWHQRQDVCLGGIMERRRYLAYVELPLKRSTYTFDMQSATWFRSTRSTTTSELPFAWSIMNALTRNETQAARKKNQQVNVCKRIVSIVIVSTNNTHRRISLCVSTRWQITLDVRWPPLWLLCPSDDNPSWHDPSIWTGMMLCRVLVFSACLCLCVRALHVSSSNVVTQHKNAISGAQSARRPWWCSQCKKKGQHTNTDTDTNTHTHRAEW